MLNFSGRELKPHSPHVVETEGVAKPLLSVRNLEVEFRTSRGLVRAVRDVNFDVAPGEIIALVGESGSGKSVSALSVMGLLPKANSEVRGSIMFDGRNLLSLNEHEMRTIRGRQISMIFQEPMTSLNPVLTIGLQIIEPLQTHLGLTTAEAEARAVELMSLVGIPDPESRLNSYPHQFSGGMRQRVMIAIGLACNPKLIIADEPTTALDVTIQAQILELMRDLTRKLGISLIIITHNLGIVARYADRVFVMYAGRLVEEGNISPIFETPRHPYTMGLLLSVPRLDQGARSRLNAIEGLPPDPSKEIAGCPFADRCPFRIEICSQPPQLEFTDVGTRAACFRSDEIAEGKLKWRSPQGGGEVVSLPKAPTALVELQQLSKSYWVKKGGIFGRIGEVRAVADLDLQIQAGETLGLVGESGCGKTTVGRLLLAIDKPTRGTIRFDGQDIYQLNKADFARYRHDVQVIFQDPYSSLNPRMTVAQMVEEPMIAHRTERSREARQDRVRSLLDQVGLRPEIAERYPHQLSGGQRQRVGIARALALNPRFIVCDEAVSALDVSIQGQVINLLIDLQKQFNLTYLFIAHDLAVVRHISTRVAVMYLGRLMELASRDELYENPLHPYTRLLLDAAPVPDPELERQRPVRVAQGEIPSPLNPPQGCVFSTRCPLASAECKAQVPQPREVRPGHYVACIKV